MDIYLVPKDELLHYGVKGMKWGHRKARVETVARTSLRNSKQEYKNAKATAKAQYKQAKQTYNNDPQVQAARAERRKKAIKAGAVVVGTALAAYGAYKVNDYVKSKNCQIAAKKGYEYAEKAYGIRVNNEVKRTLTPGVVKETIKISSNSGTAARNAAKRASNDNFRTAAKNVIDYRKSEGKGSLKNLASANYYINQVGSNIEFEKRRR